MKLTYIAGKWCAASTGKTFQSINPSSGDVIEEVPLCSEDDVRLAVEAAERAFLDWSNQSLDDRCKIVAKAAEILAEEYGQEGEPTALKNLISAEVGKRLPEADIEVIESSDMLRYFSERAASLYEQESLSVDPTLWPTKSVYLIHEPIGVVAAIKAWNYPLEIPLWTVGTALVAGNTVVFKPSEHSPLVGLYIAELFEKAGLPPGVLNIVTGEGKTGANLAEHPEVDLVAFTGSVRTGKALALSTVTRLARTDLELGGNDAAIVLNDADLELAANGLVWGGVCNTGQVCVGVKRVFAVRDVSDQLTDLVVEKLGDLRSGVDFGPLISSAQRNAYEAFLDDATKKGAKIVGSAEVDRAGPGFFSSPCVLRDVSLDAKLLSEECFGPVIPIIAVDSEDEAIRLANDSSYGLGASVWSANRERARSVAGRLNVGMVWINDVNVAFAQVPWTSRGESGGGAELGDAGLLAYTQIKTVCEETGSEKTRPWWYPY